MLSMTLLERIFCFVTALLFAFGGTLLFKSAFVSGSSECSEIEFPCEDGSCIDSGLWCDSSEDCPDGSDEKYCKKSSYFNKDPNRCPSSYFKCINGPCIPMIGICDDYADCDDSSDEMYCTISTAPSQVTLSLPTSTTVLTTRTQIEGSSAASFFASLNSSQNPMQVVEFSGWRLSSIPEQKNKARNWIVNQRRGDYGWGDETHRSITALWLSDQQILRTTENDLLMIKQLELQLSLELERNETKPMKLTDLALYINALLVSCKDPKNFYGENIVNILRDNVNVAQKKGIFVNPTIYLTLCMNNATTYDDTKQLLDISFDRNETISKLHMQSLALLTAACLVRNTNYLNSSMYDKIKMEFLRNVKIYGFPGNVYDAALLAQALQEIKVTITGLSDFILNQQQADGSFGDILSTYLVLPVLSGRNLVHINDYCGQRNKSDLIPLEVLKNEKSKKTFIQYSLTYGNPPEITHTLKLHVANGTNFLDVMRLAQEISPKYRFKMIENRDAPVVYFVGEMPNDVEKGLYWILYKASENNTEITNEVNRLPYNEDIRKLILADGDEVLFWYRPL